MGEVEAKQELVTGFQGDVALSGAKELPVTEGQRLNLGARRVSLSEAAQSTHPRCTLFAGYTPIPSDHTIYHPSRV